jgi:surface antigen
MKRRVLALTVLLGVLTWAATGFGQTTEPLAPPEQQAMSDTFQNALEYNKTDQASHWVNPDTKRSGAVAPIKTFTNAQGQPCREFTSTITIGGKAEQGYGTACRQPDGTWQIVGNEQQPTPQAPPPSNVYIYQPPAQYYAYPSGFYYPYNIFLSFGYVFRDGHLYRGRFYLNGRHFHQRYPIHVRERIFIGPRIYHDHNWYRHWERREHRNFRRYGWPNPDRGRRDWRRRHR